MTTCARHPDTETLLSCGRCGTPICPKCMVMTDVGARCPQCAPARKLPQFELGPMWVSRGVGGAIAGGIGFGAIWGLLLPGAFGFFAIIIGLGLGWGVAETVGIATNRKSGTALQVAAAFGVVLAYLVRNTLADNPLFPADDLFGYLVVIIAIVVAINRLRF